MKDREWKKSEENRRSTGESKKTERPEVHLKSRVDRRTKKTTTKKQRRRVRQVQVLSKPSYNTESQ